MTRVTVSIIETFNLKIKFYLKAPLKRIKKLRNSNKKSLFTILGSNCQLTVKVCVSQ